MKRVILAACVVFMSQFLVAQDLEKALKQANERYEKYNAVLIFSDEQQERVKNLIDGIEQKKEYVRVDANLSDEQKTEFDQKNEAAFESILISWLTDEQKVKYKQAFVTDK